MQYLITFLEGIVSFLSPCMLPLLPAYVGYFAGGMERKRRTVLRACMFVLGFALVFGVVYAVGLLFISVLFFFTHTTFSEMLYSCYYKL